MTTDGDLGIFIYLSIYIYINHIYIYIPIIYNLNKYLGYLGNHEHPQLPSPRYHMWEHDLFDIFKGLAPRYQDTLYIVGDDFLMNFVIVTSQKPPVPSA